jgi:hypothetical protein
VSHVRHAGELRAGPGVRILVENRGHIREFQEQGLCQAVITSCRIGVSNRNSSGDACKPQSLDVLLSVD